MSKKNYDEKYLNFIAVAKENKKPQPLIDLQSTADIPVGAPIVEVRDLEVQF